MATILVTHGVPREGFSMLETRHQLLIPAPLCAFSRAELARLLPEADAVVACGPLDGALIGCAKRLRIIANYGSGYDAVDTAAAAAHGIPVTNIPDVTAQATAELAIGLLLAAARRIGEMNLRLRHESPAGLFGMGCEMGATLRGKRLGIIGMGRIGTEVARIAKALGMTVDGLRRRDMPPEHQRAAVLSLISRVDVVSLHCPLTAETRRLMDAEAFAAMKPGSLLINTSRGAVVDCEALADAVERGQLAGAGLDVYPDEPAVPARLLALKQVVLTPHVGTNTIETRYAMAEACGQQILAALAGRQPEHVVNGVQPPSMGGSASERLI